MVNEFSELFRARQTVHDLTQVVLRSSTRSFDRIASLAPPDRVSAARSGLSFVAAQDDMCFDDADCDAAHDAVRLAAALPGDGFEPFITATALLLLDRLNGGRRSSDLHWYFEPFAKDYARALPWHRAAIFNGYRMAADMRAVVLDDPVPQDECFTRTRDEILSAEFGESTMSRRVLDLIRTDAEPDMAGAAWSAYTSSGERGLEPAFRYLYERPQSLQAPRALKPPLIPVPV